MIFLVNNGQILVVFGQKRANFEFPTKNRNGHFFTFIKPRPHEKNQKNLMRQFENMSTKHGIWSILAKNGKFWIFEKKTKRPFFYVYKAKASWEKSEKSDVSLRKYEQKTLILGYFCQFWTIFSQKRTNFEFSAKKRNCHFFTVTESQVHEKSQKNLMRGFLRKRTDGRTSVNP